MGNVPHTCTRYAITILLYFTYMTVLIEIISIQRNMANQEYT